MRAGVSGLDWATALTVSLAATAVAALPAVPIGPPSGSWIVDGDGLHEVRVAYGGPVAIPDGAVRVRTARRGFIAGFETLYDERTGVLAITFAPAIRADRVSIMIDDASAAGGRTVLRYVVLGGDVNRDGAVGVRDLARVVAAVGTCRRDTVFDALADLDGDGCVGPADAAIVVAGLGAALPPARGVVPLPAVAGSLPGVFTGPPVATEPLVAPRPMVAIGGGGAPPASFSSQARALYDHGQVGALGPVSVVRDYATRDAMGAAVAAHEPRWGRPQPRGPLQEWTLARSTAQSIKWVASGFDRHGTDPMLCYFPVGLEHLSFWIDTPVDDGDPSFTLDLARDWILDMLVGSALEQPFIAYEPKAGIVLPGCFLFMCERWRDVNENPAFRSWRVEGISVIALQRDVTGDFALEIVGDGPPLNGDGTALGIRRGRPWAMTAYYPVIAGQVPLLRAFIPVVDYINDATIKKGGQVFLFDAMRPDTQTPWSFGEFFLVGEHVEDGTHFHTAAWTPRGVVVAMGDTSARNENILYTCANWEDYANPFNWITHERAYGAGTHPDQPAGSVALQFGGAVPGRDPMHFLVGADANGGGVYECSVPEDPAEGLTFTRLWGEHWTDGASGGHVALWFHKPAPERSRRSVTRVSPQTLPADVALQAARIVYSDDDVNFMTVARLPSTTHRQSYVALHGDDILLFNRSGGTNPAPKGIWSMPVPVSRGPSRGLSIAPGGTNLLAVAGGSLEGAVAGGTTSLTLVTGGVHPVTGEPLDVPGLGPVYRIEADGSSGLYLAFEPTGGIAVAPGFAYLSLWIRVIGPEGVMARVQLTDIGGMAGQADWPQRRVTSREQWVPYTVMVDTTEFAGDFTPLFRLIADPVSRVADFLILIDGFYVNGPPPYSTAPGTTSPVEQVTQPLGALGDSWTIGVEMNVPYSSEDWLGHPSASADGGRVYLATVFADDGNYAEVYAALDQQAIGVDVYQGGVPAGTTSVGGIALQRGDRLWVALAQSSPSELVVYAWSGGSTEDGLLSATCPAGLTVPPAQLRFGRADFSRVPAMDVFMVAVERARALGKDGVLHLLATDGDVTSGLPQVDP